MSSPDLFIDRRLPVTVLSGFLGADKILRTEGLGSWWVAVPKERWPKSPEFKSMINRHWTPSWGDRRQEIVFIGGADMDEMAIRAALDECLVGSVTTGISKSHLNLPDPFPVWSHEQAA